MNNRANAREIQQIINKILKSNLINLDKLGGDPTPSRKGDKDKRSASAHESPEKNDRANAREIQQIINKILKSNLINLDKLGGAPTPSR